MHSTIIVGRTLKAKRAKEDHQTRVRLAKIVEGHLDETGLTQTEAAEIMVDAPSQVSLVCTGKVRGFSIMRLLRMIRMLGHDITITVSETKTQKPGKLTIIGPR